MFAKVKSGTFNNADGYIVDVEVDISNGMIRFDIVGLPGLSVNESSNRVKTAIINSKYNFPMKHITVNLAPADTRKEGPAFDLPIAVGILVCMGVIPHSALDQSLFLGEISLDGYIRPVRGVLPIVHNASKNGINKFFVPLDNGYEAAMVKGVEVYEVGSLTDLIEHFKKNILKPVVVDYNKLKERITAETLDYADVQGQYSVKRALEIAASGYHNALMVGPPGSGKTMMAKRFPSILPDLSFNECIEVTKVYSVAGLVRKDNFLVIKRPFRSPHHTTTYAALAGGGKVSMPGEISLAHNGVLFLDEMTEFDKKSLEVLRQPIEEKQITISRSNYKQTYPCSFLLLASMNPCPCGYYPDEERCKCRPNQISNYLHKISGPLLDRIDIQTEAPSVKYDDIKSTKRGEPSCKIKERVLKAQKIQRERYKNGSIRYNSEMTPEMVKKYCVLTDEGERILKSAFEGYDLSVRAYHKVLKISRTIADMEESEVITALHVIEAISYRNLDKKYW